MIQTFQPSSNSDPIEIMLNDLTIDTLIIAPFKNKQTNSNHKKAWLSFYSLELCKTKLLPQKYCWGEWLNMCCDETGCEWDAARRCCHALPKKPDQGHNVPTPTIHRPDLICADEPVSASLHRTPQPALIQIGRLQILAVILNHTGNMVKVTNDVYFKRMHANE